MQASPEQGFPPPHFLAQHQCSNKFKIKISKEMLIDQLAIDI